MKLWARSGIALRVKGGAVCPQVAAGAVRIPRPTDFRVTFPQRRLIVGGAGGGEFARFARAETGS